MTSETVATEGLDIAIIGMAGRWPGADSVDALWRNLRAGVEAVRFFSDAELLAAGISPELLEHPSYVKAGACLDDVTGFDARFFDYTPREAEAIDPQQRLFLEAAWAALEDAGYPPLEFAGQIAVYAGASVNTYLFNNLFAALGTGSADDYSQIIIASDKDFLATRVSYKLNLRGPSMTVQSACSTSLVATQLAVQSLLNYQCDLALAGGVSLSFPHTQGYMYQPGGILAPDGHCRPFDAQAAGTFKGNGLGVVVLKRLEDALADGDHIFAVIKGAAINNDGNLKAGYSAPSQEGQAAVIAAAHALADIEPDSIGYIEAHGTATPLGDPIEVAALTQAFRAGTSRTQFCALGSIKSNLGHLDAAAGVTGLIKTALALHHAELPPSLHFTAPNPALQLEQTPFYVNSELAPWPAGPEPRRAGVSAFGIGGTNVHVVLEEAPAQARQPSAPAPWQVLPLSAKSPGALAAATRRLAEHCAEQPALALADVAHTLTTRREVFEQRCFVVAASLAEAQFILDSGDPQRLLSGSVAHAHPELTFMFPGAGSQYPAMGRELYAALPAFRAAVDRCAAYVAAHEGLDLRALLLEPAAASATDAPLAGGAALLPLFTMEYALAQQWLDWQLQPTMLIGHSLGEYVAACIAETITLEDALKLVALRGRLFDSLPEGRCFSIALPADAVRALLPDGAYLALVNGPTQCVVTGLLDIMDGLAADLDARGIQFRAVSFNRPVHSPLLEPILAEFGACARTIAMREPRIPYISNVTGTWIGPAELRDPDYWVRHLASAVQFDAGLRTILEAGPGAVLEVGPGQSFSSLVRRHPLLTPQHAVVPSGHYPHDEQADLAVLLTALGRLWVHGVAVDWARAGVGLGGFVRLPTYAFEHTSYCLAPLAHVAQATERPAAAPPAPTYGRPQLLTPYVAPRNASEELLAQCWGAVIGIAAIGVHDNFFDLGGDSLLALQLAAAVAQTCAAPVDPAMILAAPTIAELAARIATDAGPELPADLVLLQSGAAAVPPLFLVHPSGGLALGYAELARLLGSDQPVYGLQARGVDGLQAPRHSIAEMAHSYVAALRAVQPTGPYHLGGWSMGGLIALEMARELEAAAEPVALVALLDTPARQAGVDPATLDDAELAWALLGPELDAAADAGDLEQLLALALERQYLPPGFTLAQLQHFVGMFRAHAQASWDYAPQPYAGPVLLLRASATLESAVRFGFDAATADADLGWRDYLAALTTCPVPGSHQTLLHAPYVQEVAAALSAALSAAPGALVSAERHHE